MKANRRKRWTPPPRETNERIRLWGANEGKKKKEPDTTTKGDAGKHCEIDESKKRKSWPDTTTSGDT